MKKHIYCRGKEGCMSEEKKKNKSKSAQLPAAVDLAAM